MSFVITPFGIMTAGEFAAAVVRSQQPSLPKSRCYKCKREDVEMNHRFWSPILGGNIDDLDDWKFMDGQSNYSPLCEECTASFCPCSDCKCFMKPAHVQICNECDVNLCPECAPTNFFSQSIFSNDSDPTCDKCQNPKSEECSESEKLNDESGKATKGSNKEPEAEQKSSKQKRKRSTVKKSKNRQVKRRKTAKK